MISIGAVIQVNRNAKLKQCKLDARREQWLAQGETSVDKFLPNYNRFLANKDVLNKISHEVRLSLKRLNFVFFPVNEYHRATIMDFSR